MHCKISTDFQNGGCDDVIPVGQNGLEKDSNSDEVFWLNYSPVLSPNSNIPLYSEELSYLRILVNWRSPLDWFGAL